MVGELKDETISKESSLILGFEVEDSGSGISANQLEHIFQPFGQAKESDKQIEGTGLGLAISQQIMELMGSQLSVKSQPEQGSTFWFEITLPVIEQPTHEKPSSRSTRNIEGYEGTRRKVLVVDDKLYNRLLLVDMLEPLGFVVNTAENGQEAIDKALAWQPDAIVMDLVMPVKTGFEATREIRQQAALKDVCIIAASASVLEADQEKSRVAGCDAFLHKPIKTESLLDLLATNLKLAWTYAEPDGEAEGKSALVPPPQAELLALYQLAQSGQIIDIQEHVNSLITLDKAYLPFLNHLQKLAGAFEIEQIKVFIKQYLKDKKDEQI